MAMKSRASKVAAPFDVKSLSAELGATVKEGRVSAARGKYFVAIGAKKVEIPVGQFVAESNVRKMLGKTVAVLVSGGSLIAISDDPIPVGKCFWILCYKPVDIITVRLQDRLREAVISQFVQAGILTQKQVPALLATRGQ